MAAYVIVAVLSLFIGLVAGGSKGFAGLGAFLGLLLGPLGVLIVLCMKPTVEVQAQRAEALEAARARLRTQSTAAQAPPREPVRAADVDPWGDAPTRRR